MNLKRAQAVTVNSTTPVDEAIVFAGGAAQLVVVMTFDLLDYRSRRCAVGGLIVMTFDLLEPVHT